MYLAKSISFPKKVNNDDMQVDLNLIINKIKINKNNRELGFECPKCRSFIMTEPQRQGHIDKHIQTRFPRV